MSYETSKRLPETLLKMATTAIHLLGDISSCTPRYCVVSSEDEENFYGNWLTGYGFFGVQFPKTTTRDLTAEEQKWYDDNEHRIRIGTLKEALQQKDPIR